ncbi:helix-turn-helix domain-containing protein [Oricola indica]|uniref:helix-turn-helix domain-containing protein n=1 Tax=Oricola indica TaxID=2872591 RepID=UPI003D17837C
MISGAQIRSARVMLGWTQKQLAEKAAVGFTTVQRAEQSTGAVLGTVTTVMKLRSALEGGGILFLDQESDVGPGIRLRYPQEL